MAFQNSFGWDSTLTKVSEPIIFTIRKLKPDVRFFVFDTEYHVYSGALKLHSEFFERFLEPSGGIAPSSTSLDFKSDWYTDIDDDGSWHLTSDSHVRRKDHTIFKGDQAQEQKAFNNILCAMFNRDYTITNGAELKSMVDQADYLCALTVISHSVSNVLQRSPGLLSDIKDHPCTILLSALTLRHGALFRDSLIFSLGPWSSPRYAELQHQAPGLYSIAQTCYDETMKAVQQFWTSLPQLVVKKPDPGYSNHFTVVATEVFRSVGSSVDIHKNFLMPSMIRSIDVNANNLTSALQRNFLKNAVAPLLKNNLLLHPSAEAGTDIYNDYFLCFEIKDEQLPWDTTQEDS